MGRALAVLDQSHKSFTAAEYTRALSKEMGLKPTRARKLLNCLVKDRELTYIDLYGSTRIQRNFLKPVQITDHFILTPPDQTANGNGIPITITPGISFGSGQHPTTQLCLELMDQLFWDRDFLQRHPSAMAADVGTGSGVLALAACKGGMAHCHAWEIDPVSLNEARQNIRHNQLESRVHLSGDYMPVCPDQFHLICANLRYPTLKALLPLFSESLKPNGYLILSGFREWEFEDLIAHSRTQGFSLLEAPFRHQWGALLLTR